MPYLKNYLLEKKRFLFPLRVASFFFALNRLQLPQQ